MAVPKKKHAGGRPPLYKSVKDIEVMIDKYFTYCDNRIKTIYSEKAGDDIQISDPEPYTMSGLAYYLGMDRQTLINYTNKDQFFDTIKRARDRVEMDLDRRLNDKATFTTGQIFSAKNNFGWKDESKVENTIKTYKPLLENLKDVSDNFVSQEIKEIKEAN